jgi:hypothetical protein
MNYEDLVKTIRESKDLGRGSCSWVDECLTDEELVEHLKALVEGDGLIPPMEKPTPKKVLRELKRINRIVLERMG